MAVLRFQRVPVSVCDGGRKKSHQAKNGGQEKEARSLHVGPDWGSLGWFEGRFDHVEHAPYIPRHLTQPHALYLSGQCRPTTGIMSCGTGNGIPTLGETRICGAAARSVAYRRNRTTCDPHLGGFRRLIGFLLSRHCVLHPCCT